MSIGTSITLLLPSTLAPRDEICLFAHDVPYYGLSLRSHYVFIPVLSVDKRVSQEASTFSGASLVPLHALRPCFTFQRFFVTILYMIHDS
jgi:hypothetical protein